MDLASAWTTTAHRLYEGLGEPLDGTRPVAVARLAEKAHRWIPGVVAASQVVAPVGRIGDQHPHGDAHGAGKVRNRSIYSDHEVEVRHDRRGVGKIHDPRRQVDEAHSRRRIGGLRGGLTYLQAVEDRAAGAGKRRQQVEREGAFAIVPLLRPARPYESNLEPGRIQHATPGGDLIRMRANVRTVPGYVLQSGAEVSGQAHEGSMRGKLRQGLTARQDALHSRGALQQADELRLAFEHHRSTARRGERRIAHELQRVPEPLLRVQQQRAAFDAFAIPHRRRKPARGLVERRNAPAPLVFPPPFAVAAEKKQNERPAEVGLRQTRRERQGALVGGQRLLVAAELAVGVAKVVERHCVFGMCRGMALVVRDRALQGARIARNGRIVLVGLRQPWVELERSAVRGERFLQLSLHVQDAPQVVMGTGMIGLPLDGIAVRGLGLDQASRVLPQPPHDVVRGRGARVRRLGAPGPLQALLGATLVRRDGRQETERARVGRRACQQAQGPFASQLEIAGSVRRFHPAEARLGPPPAKAQLRLNPVQHGLHGAKKKAPRRAPSSCC